MRQMPTAVATVVLGSIAILLTPDAAEAQYLDPGAGSIIVQVVVAVVAGTAATVRLYWHRIAPFLHRRRERKDQ